MAQMVKCLPTMQETQVQSLGQEDPLGKEMATHSSTLAWKIPWTEEHGRLQSRGLQRVGHDFTFTFSPVKGFSTMHLPFLDVNSARAGFLNYHFLLEFCVLGTLVYVDS